MIFLWIGLGIFLLFLAYSVGVLWAINHLCDDQYWDEY